TVSPTGLATGIAEGTVDITATSANGISATTRLSVAQAGNVGSVTISINAPRQAPVGFTKPAFPTVKDADGANVTVSTTLLWTSSNPDIATVSQLGYVTGLAPGTATIKAAAPNGVFGTSTFTVIPASAPTTALYRNHVDFGTPTDNTPDDEIILSKPQYVASYNKSRGGPNWVSWNIDSTHFGEAPRCDCFSADQSLPADAYHVVDYDYRDGKYDRGHMVQSESRTTTDQENATTFLLTNILPQGGENNQGPWSKFENYLNDLARGTPSDRTMHEIYVIAGGEYAAVPGTLKGEGKVAIPDYTWKIAVVMDRGKGLADVHSFADLRVIAVKMPNLITPGVAASAVGIRNNPWEQYQTTVRELENETHYNFLSALPDNIELLVETNDRPPVASWNAPVGEREGSPVTFDGSASSDPDAGDALTYAWDFGDGALATAAAPVHTYADNGSYSVTLTVRDPAGAEDTQTKVVTISNEPPVVTSLTVSPSVISGETVHALAGFTDAGIADNPWSYAFTWGSGTPEVASTADQSMSLGSDAAFFQAGTYTVTLTVTDKDGAKSPLRSATFSVLPISVPMSVSPDQINIRNQGAGEIVVTLLGSREIGASSIDEHSIRIGTRGVDAKGNGAPKGALEDVNGDGFQDLVLHFSRSALVGERLLTSETRELVLHANLVDHREIEARGRVKIITKQ
ncbi:MAG: DNA/RNA non-specific endonuclease, partial [Gemmatimonadaceae bacterium]